MSDNLKESTSLKTNIDKYSDINSNQEKDSFFKLFLIIIIILAFISTLIYYIFVYNNFETEKNDLYAEENNNSLIVNQTEEINCTIGFFSPEEVDDDRCIRCKTKNCAKCSGTTKKNICSECKEEYIPIYSEDDEGKNKIIKECVKKCELGEEQKCSTCDEKALNLCGSCNPFYKLENGKCILNYSFKAIYKTNDKNQNIILINKNYINEITELIIDNKSVTPSYNYTFNNEGEHDVVMLLNTNNLDTGKMMFYNISNLITINFTKLFDTSNMMNMKGMFKDCINIKSLKISAFNTKKITDFSFMFDNCTSLTSIDLSSFNTENAYDISYMFSNCIYLENISLKSFNTINVVDMTGLFNGCSSLTSIDDITHLKAGKTKYMLYMFNGCSSLKTLNIDSFYTINVKDMSYMFKDCSKLKTIELNNLKTDNLANLEGIFMGCSKLTKVDLKNWDVKNIKNINKMFYGCNNLNDIDISCFKNITAVEKIEIFDEDIGKNGKIVINNNFYNKTKEIIPSDWKIIENK